jgi:hypothetical protein
MFCRRTKAPPKAGSISNNQKCDPLLHCSNKGMLVAFARKTNHRGSGLSRLSNGSVGRKIGQSEQLSCSPKLFI